MVETFLKLFASCSISFLSCDVRIYLEVTLEILRKDLESEKTKGASRANTRIMERWNNKWDKI